MSIAAVKDIAGRIRLKNCVPVLGAAANLKIDPDYEGLLIGGQVAEQLAGDLSETVADRQNLPRVSLIFERETGRIPLIQKLKDLLPDEQREPSLLLQTLGRLPFDLYITTNYDRLLEKALAHRNPIVVVQTPKRLESAELIQEWIDIEDESLRPPLIYKIHGSFKELEQPREKGEHPTERSPLIITEDDYIDFLTLLGSEENGVHRVIRSRLATSALLFLGYSLDDWDFRALYKIISNTITDKEFRQPAYSVQSKVKSYWRDFWLLQGIKILDQDIYDFAQQLRQQFIDLFPDAGASP